jgi:hypothetical protein
VETGRGVRAVCYCNSCREFAIRTGAESALDPAGGSDLYQVAPEEIVFQSGADGLSWLRLTDKGPARWFTTCCNTPVANTLGTQRIPFVTLQTHRLADQDQLPPVSVRVFRRDATGRVPDDGKGVVALYLNFAGRMLRSWISGGWRRNPFFGKDGKPIAPRSKPTAPIG